jgi:hypothetical protein
MTCGCEIATCAGRCLVNLTGYYSGQEHLYIISACGQTTHYLSEGYVLLIAGAFIITGVVLGALIAVIIHD